MAPSSSSTRKAARLAQKGKGKRVRFQGGTIFPLVVAIVLVLGVALVTYARASRPKSDASPPQPGLDHWHAAYGFQLCSDEPNIVFAGALEEMTSSGQYADRNFANTGVHSHDDGVIHWHPYTQKAAGNRAKLSIFFDNYGLDISDTRLRLPVDRMMFEETRAPLPDDFIADYEDGETTCGDEEGVLKAVVWPSANDRNNSSTYTSNFGDIRMVDGAVIVIAFVPDDVDVVMPPWAADLERLGAADQAQVTQGSNPDAAVETMAPEDTAAAGSEPADSPTTEAPAETTEPTASTEPAASTTPATTDGD